MLSPPSVAEVGGGGGSGEISVFSYSGVVVTVADDGGLVVSGESVATYKRQKFQVIICVYRNTITTLYIVSANYSWVCGICSFILNLPLLFLIAADLFWIKTITTATIKPSIVRLRTAESPVTVDVPVRKNIIHIM